MKILIHLIHAAWLLIPAVSLAQSDQQILPTQIQTVYALAAVAGFDREEVDHISVRTLGGPIERLTRHRGAQLIIIYRSLARGFEGKVDPATGLMSTLATQSSRPARPEPRRTAPAPQLPPPQPASPVAPVTSRTQVTGGGSVLLTMARANAREDHDSAYWRLRGGLLTAGGTWFGSLIGIGIGGGGGFLMGAGLGAVGTAEILARANSREVPIPVELESVSPRQQEQYRQLYQAETRQLRKQSIYSGLRLVGNVIIGSFAVMIGLVIITF